MENKKSKQYKELCLKDKIEVINFLRNNSQRAAAEKFQISKTCVSNIFKRKSEYLQRFEENENESRSRKIRKNDNFEVNTATFEWFKKMRGMNARLSGPLLQEAALEFAKKLNVENFSASNGWLESFKKRHNISQKILCGESHDVDMETVDSFKRRISDLLENYKKEDIFNADECGLFYKAMPNRTLAMAGDKCKDGKISKERITILLSCSSTGEKLKPLVIGKAKKPRCFKKVDIKKLPVSWYGNKNAWMTSSIFTEWVTQLNKQMKQKKRKILLFIDNCPAHPKDLQFSNVKVQYLPANTTSHLQPLDQGIIQAFKLRYRKFLLQAIIARAEECKSANEIASCINVLDAIMWINDSWNLVCQTTISKCFVKSGFSQQISEDISDSQSENDGNSLSNIQNLINQLPLEEELMNADLFMNFDSDIPTWNTSVDQESLKQDICDMFKNEKENEEDCASEDEVEIQENDEISDAEMLNMCKKMKTYALNNCPPMLDLLRKLEGMTENIIVEKKCFKQRKISDFFSVNETLQ